MTDQDTYTDRTVKVVKVKKKDEHSVTFEDGWSWGAPGILDQLEVGQEYLEETVNFSEVTGLATIFRSRHGEAVVLQWLMHKTDADREREHQEFVAELRRKDEERLAENESYWRDRESRLSEPLRKRLERFRENGGREFDLSSWGYELIVCELADMYVASGLEDSDEILEFAGEQGTSGNQHDVAKAIAALLIQEREEDVSERSISALTPLTGDPDYSKAGRGR
jgi:hypothetical protein